MRSLIFLMLTACYCYLLADARQPQQLPSWQFHPGHAASCPHCEPLLMDLPLPEPEPSAPGKEVQGEIESMPADEAFIPLKQEKISQSSNLKNLDAVVGEMQDYLDVQQRRGAVKIARKVNAEYVGGECHLLVGATPDFLAQEKTVQLEVISTLRNFWAMRCISSGICKDSEAVLIILDSNQNQIGNVNASRARLD